MPPPPPQQGSQNDNSMWMLWLITLIFCVIFGVWYAYKPQVVSFFIRLKLWEVSALALFVPKLETTKASLELMLRYPSSVSYNELVHALNVVGYTIRYVTTGVIFLFGYMLFRSSVVPKYRRRYDMESLKKAEVVNWPHITPVVNHNLVNTHVDEGKWAMAQTPMDFAKKHHLVTGKEKPLVPGKIRKEKEYEAELDRGRANEVFALQLGAPWRGLKPLNMHTRALFAAFAARGDGDRKTCDNLLLRLSKTSHNGVKNMDFKGVNELCRKHVGSKPVQKVLRSHAYTMTVMAAMLELARYDGVLATADFLWLKPVDRRLWFTLNAVGRQTPSSEVAGIIAHWKAEAELGRPLIVPVVDQAADALELALKEVIYRPPEEE